MPKGKKWVSVFFQSFFHVSVVTPLKEIFGCFYGEFLDLSLPKSMRSLKTGSKKIGVLFMQSEIICIDWLRTKSIFPTCGPFNHTEAHYSTVVYTRLKAVVRRVSVSATHVVPASLYKILFVVSVFAATFERCYF